MDHVICRSSQNIDACSDLVILIHVTTPPSSAGFIFTGVRGNSAVANLTLASIDESNFDSCYVWTLDGLVLMEFGLLHLLCLSFVLFLPHPSHGEWFNNIKINRRSLLRLKTENAAPSVQFDPTRITQLLWHPRAFLYKGFLTHQECYHRIKLVRVYLRSTVHSWSYLSSFWSPTWIAWEFLYLCLSTGFFKFYHWSEKYEIPCGPHMCDCGPSKAGCT